MPIIENVNPMIVIAVIAGLLSIYYFLSLLGRIKKLRMFSALQRLSAFLLFALISLTISVVVIGTEGYLALVKEEAVATLTVSPTGKQSFHARMDFNDGSHQVFALKGDELMVDAYVLKWKPWVNLLALHTAYRLDRIRGRYSELDDEKNKEQTVYAINVKSNRGLAQWREDFQVLALLLDVEHGSASFASAEKNKVYQLVVTTNGLLIRPKVQSLKVEG